MFDINATPPAGDKPAEELLAKAHPAATLAAPQPGWNCNTCKKRNTIRDPFCKHCEDGQ